MRVTRAAGRPEARIGPEIMVEDRRDHAVSGKDESGRSAVPAGDDADGGDELDRIARKSSTGAPGRKLELACASALSQLTILSSPLKGKIATRQVLAIRGSPSLTSQSIISVSPSPGDGCGAPRHFPVSIASHTTSDQPRAGPGHRDRSRPRCACGCSPRIRGCTAEKPASRLATTARMAERGREWRQAPTRRGGCDTCGCSGSVRLGLPLRFVTSVKPRNATKR